MSPVSSKGPLPPNQFPEIPYRRLFPGNEEQFLSQTGLPPETGTDCRTFHDLLYVTPDLQTAGKEVGPTGNTLHCGKYHRNFKKHGS